VDPGRSAADLTFINGVTAEGDDQEQTVVQSIQHRTGKAPYTVLIIEDDPDLQYVCARTLEGIGCKVLKASGSSEALKVCSAYVGPIHLLLVDLILRPTVFQLQGDGTQHPRVHGTELVDHLLRIIKKSHVVFMTGHNDSALQAIGIDIRGGLCLHKPFSREDLLTAVDRAMAIPPLVWKEPHHEKPARKTGNAR
jgi:CheY-like chemotaxis protein